eukprot:6344489-Alexandrium_andersonii.AAC.1
MGECFAASIAAQMIRACSYSLCEDASRADIARSCFGFPAEGQGGRDLGEASRGRGRVSQLAPRTEVVRRKPV